LTNLSIPKNKTHFDPKLNFDFLAREIFKNYFKTAGRFPGRCVYFLGHRICHKHQII
jgi:hypothetical protein